MQSAARSFAAGETCGNPESMRRFAPERTTGGLHPPYQTTRHVLGGAI
jgi:hypothetical protein